MNEIANELSAIVESATEYLLAMSESQSQQSHSADHWSAKQVLGHLIDSAANNHQRFVRAQFMPDLVFPGYDQEQWIQAQQYEAEPWLALVKLWQAYNAHLAHVIARIPEVVLTRERHPHTLDKIAWQTVRAEEPTTLAYLIQDYVGHLQEHLAQLREAADG